MVQEHYEGIEEILELLLYQVVIGTYVVYKYTSLKSTIPGSSAFSCEPYLRTCV